MKLQALGVLVLLAAVVACEPMARRPQPASVAQSNTVAMLANGNVASLDADHNQVVILAADGTVHHRIDVGQRPAQLAVQGNTVAVSNRGDRTVTLVDASQGIALRTVTVGVEPHGVAFLGDGRLAVTLFGEDKLALVDVATGAVERISLQAGGGARGLVVVGGNQLLVSHLLGDALTSLQVGRTGQSVVPLRVAVGGAPLNPSLVESLTASPDGAEVSAPHVQLNNEGVRPSMNSGGGGYLGTPGQMPAVSPALATVDPRTNTMTSNTTDADVQGAFGCPGCTAPAVPGSSTSGRPSALLTAANGTVPADHQLNEPVQVAYLDGGRGVAVLARGSRNVFIWRRDSSGNRQELLQVSPVGAGADGMTVSADGNQLLVHNAFDLTLSVVDLPELDFGGDGRGATFLGKQAQTLRIPATRDVAPSATWKFAEVTLPDAVDQGRRLFHDATLTGMTTGQGITCSTCHADGRNDNKTWMFIDGPRNTPSLAGAAPGRPGLATTTAPLHWKGELHNHQDLERTVTEFMGGTGLNSTQLDQLAAFIDAIPEPDNAFRDDTALFAQQVRGAELFYSPTVACNGCHTGQHFTDNQNHNVFTDEDGISSTGAFIAAGFQTPVLHGLAFTAPYGHDGRYPTLEALLLDLVRGGKMRHETQDPRTLTQLSDQDLADLAAFLRTL